MERRLQRRLDAVHQVLPALERCRECRGRLVEDGEDVVCTSCGVVAREGPIAPTALTTTRRVEVDLHLGSYLGPITERGSHASFNDNSTVGYAKLVSDNLGESSTAWGCSAMVERTAERLSLPVSVRDSAIAASKRILRERKEGNRNEIGRISVPTISAYSILYACRSAGIDRVGVDDVLKTLTDMGHRVSASKLLRLGTTSRIQLLPARPSGLLSTVVGSLAVNPSVLGRLRAKGVEESAYFHELLRASQNMLKKVARRNGCSPRTVAAGSVYLASLGMSPKAVRQVDVAEALGMAEYTIREFARTSKQLIQTPNG